MSVRVKICGITSPEQAVMAQRAGADALGLVIYGKSSRYVDIQRAAEIRAVIGSQTTAVVLLVNADEATVRQVIAEVKPDLLQFHGDESPAFCKQFDFPFIRAIRMREGLDIDAEVAAYKAEAGFLFDAWSEDQYGGTGHQFDWSRLPSSTDYPLILAGGLTPENVASAVSLVSPDMVDVSGGVESSPGVKDAAKVAAFITNAKPAQP
ncbi:MAG: phosphoribosylanthranilate isomerase [Porticoccaceae bacterium]|jgi:phosphoribosylanthranilate isomerase|nr:phosphoribosylanthranilate isomerase [Porticoccaceae bacterium]MDG1310554.1 phosphoribosylanthranilate isomerase [Porticoccaceae bacterium]